VPAATEAVVVVVHTTTASQAHVQPVSWCDWGNVTLCARENKHLLDLLIVVRAPLLQKKWGVRMACPDMPNDTAGRAAVHNAHVIYTARTKTVTNYGLCQLNTVQGALAGSEHLTSSYANNNVSLPKTGPPLPVPLVKVGHIQGHPRRRASAIP
jgi:hypothetical protein